VDTAGPELGSSGSECENELQCSLTLGEFHVELNDFLLLSCILMHGVGRYFLIVLEYNNTCHFVHRVQHQQRSFTNEIISGQKA